jgi:hypothetical protein
VTPTGHVLTRSTSTPATFDSEVEDLAGDLDRDYSGWWCVATDPWPCPAQGCDRVVDHITAAHLIVVWPRRDDPSLLEFANDAQRHGRNPRVVEYQPEMGHCIPYDTWVRIGRPVHGIRPRPSDVPFRRL